MSPGTRRRAKSAPGAAAPIDLQVSIASYRTRDLLARCLAALEHEEASLRLAVTVVDNDSRDGSAELVAERFPRVKLVVNDQNVGFARAHNQALRGSSARHLLVLNSDAEVQPGTLTTLVAYLDAHPEVAVVGPRLRHPAGNTQPSRRRFPTLATLFVESTQIGQRFWPSHPLLRRFYLSDRPDGEEQEVDWLVGACLCIRARAVAEVGLFDEQFFLYSEELDWCRRFRAAGWRIVYVPSAEVQHLEGGTSRADPLAREIQFQTSKLRYTEKWHGRGAARALKSYLVVEYTLRALEESARLALGSRPGERRQRLTTITGYLRHALRA